MGKQKKAAKGRAGKGGQPKQQQPLLGGAARFLVGQVGLLCWQHLYCTDAQDSLYVADACHHTHQHSTIT